MDGLGRNRVMSNGFREQQFMPELFLVNIPANPLLSSSKKRKYCPPITGTQVNYKIISGPAQTPYKPGVLPLATKHRPSKLCELHYLMNVGVCEQQAAIGLADKNGNACPGISFLDGTYCWRSDNNVPNIAKLDEQNIAKAFH